MSQTSSREVSIVTPARFFVLTLGPLAVIATAYVVAYPTSSTAESNTVQVVTVDQPIANQPTKVHGIASQTEQVARQLRDILPVRFCLIVRTPFVLAGDVPQSQLEVLYSGIVDPVTRALRSTYFERSPKQPIAIVICSTEAEFRRLARDWDGHIDAGYHGYYQRDKRRILLDLEAGNGSLAHELTHALSQADCEHLPEWFDEGLGALHEDATFASQDTGLIGLPNWRCRVTQQALVAGQLPSLKELTTPGDFRTGNVEVRYAMARSLCLFLQNQRLLTAYYKALRSQSRNDTSGLKTLCRILQVSDVKTAEQRFQVWIQRPAK